MTEKISDAALMAAIHERLELKEQALQDLQGMTRKLERANERLRESETLKSRFLSNIRNEITNPLTAVKGLAKQLSRGQNGPDETRALAGMIHGELADLDFHLQNIFAAADLEAGEAQPFYARTDVVSILDEVCESAEERRAAKRIAFDRKVPDCLVFATDARKLQLMFGNLLANALEFAPEESVVGIAVESSGDRLEVAVTDRGPGLTKADMGRIFERFRQLDEGSEKRHRGQGLGLSVTRALAQLLNGDVIPENDSDGGARFTLRLPEPAVEPTDLARDGNLFLFDGAETF